MLWYIGIKYWTCCFMILLWIITSIYLVQLSSMTKEVQFNHLFFLVIRCHIKWLLGAVVLGRWPHTCEVKVNLDSFKWATIVYFAFFVFSTIYHSFYNRVITMAFYYGVLLWLPPWVVHCFIIKHWDMKNS